MLNLNPKYVALLHKILSRYIPDKEVWVYGSRIKGKAHEGSDLDLVVKDPKGLSIPEKRLSALREAITESNLPILVDILDWSSLPEHFQKEIKEQHEVFFTPNST